MQPQHLLLAASRGGPYRALLAIHAEWQLRFSAWGPQKGVTRVGAPATQPWSGNYVSPRGIVSAGSLSVAAGNPRGHSQPTSGKPPERWRRPPASGKPPSAGGFQNPYIQTRRFKRPRRYYNCTNPALATTIAPTQLLLLQLHQPSPRASPVGERLARFGNSTPPCQGARAAVLPCGRHPRTVLRPPTLP